MITDEDRKRWARHDRMVTAGIAVAAALLSAGAFCVMLAIMVTLGWATI